MFDSYLKYLQNKKFQQLFIGRKFVYVKIKRLKISKKVPSGKFFKPLYNLLKIRIGYKIFCEIQPSP